MPKATAYITALLNLIFKAQNFTGVADNNSTVTSIHASLHVGSPLVGGNQQSNEATYTGYNREPVTRGSGWTVTTDHVNPAAQITFDPGTGGSGTVDYFGLGTLLTGAGVLLYFGTVTPTIATGNGVTPALSTATQVTEA